MTWLFNGKEVDVELYEAEKSNGVIGFVYCILDTVTNKKYIGKKLWVTKKKLPPLKGKTRKRIKEVETDWREYYGSNEEIKALVAEFGGSRFKREIIHLCKSKGELSYMELHEQVHRKALLSPDEYYNSIVQVRIHRNHVKSLWETNED